MEQSNIAGIIICSIGLALCVFPKVIWRISEKWKSSRASSPSSRYIITLRIVGGVFVGIGVFLAIGMIS